VNNFAIFTDVSVNNQTRRGVGGYLIIPASFLSIEPYDFNPDDISTRLTIKNFSDTSSTQLEVQTVLWALEDIQDRFPFNTLENLSIYTDSQCVAGLMKRREHLLNSDFVAKRSGQTLANAQLYREFYSAHDRFKFQLFKVPGHSQAGSQTCVQYLFSCVDRRVRSALKAVQPPLTA